MKHEEMQRYLEEYRRKYGEAVPLSKLVRTFDGFKPVYSPRHPSKDRQAAEMAAKMRSFLELIERVERQIPKLTTRPAEGSLDVKEVAVELGYAKRKGPTYVIPDYVVVLDDEAFFDFVQGLPPSIGGSKPRPSGKHTEELTRFREALSELRSSRSEAAKKFLKVYDSVQSKLRLPKD
ncbi:MAG: hypothetical protein ACIAS6_00080 [Phycisphaerales bacterium JB060]